MPSPRGKQQSLAQFAQSAFGRRTIRKAISTSNIARARSPSGSIKMIGEARIAALAAKRGSFKPGIGRSGRKPVKPSIPLAGRSSGRSGISGSGAGRRLPTSPANLGPDPAGYSLDPAGGRSQVPRPTKTPTARPAPRPRATPTPPKRQPKAKRARQVPRRRSQTSSTSRPPQRTTRNLLGIRR